MLHHSPDRLVRCLWSGLKVRRRCTRAMPPCIECIVPGPSLALVLRIILLVVLLLFFPFLLVCRLFFFELGPLYTQIFQQFIPRFMTSFFLSAVFLTVFRFVAEFSILCLHVHLSFPHCPHPSHLDGAMANISTCCCEVFAKGSFKSNHVLHAQASVSTCKHARNCIQIRASSIWCIMSCYVPNYIYTYNNKQHHKRNQRPN